jgi:cell division septation protein DedD
MLFKKISTSILLCTLISGCEMIDLEPRSSSKTDEIRMVDINGNYRPVKRHVPAHNSQLLHEQKNQRATRPGGVFDDSQEDLGTPKSDIDPDFGPAKDSLIGKNIDSSEEEIVYDISKNERVNIAEAKDELETTLEESYVEEKGTFVQVGSYLSNSSANKILTKGKNFSGGFIKKTKSDRGTMHKILLGPVKNKAEARMLLKKSRNNGFRDAFITKIK